MENRESPLAGAALPPAVAIHIEAADRLGMTVEVLDETYGYLFEVRHGSRRATLLGGRSALNDAVASRLCEDKFYTELLLRRAGIHVPSSVRCLAPGYFKLIDYREYEGMSAGIEHARALGYPVVVKPNRLSHGRGVTLVDDEADLVAAIEFAWRDDYIALVQNRAGGQDYRLDFLDGAFLIGYVRAPIEVEGDGRRTIRQLIVARDARFEDADLWRHGEMDPEWVREVTNRGWNAESVLPAAQTLHLGGGILNLNRWATADVIETLPKPWLDFCLRIGETLKLRHFGVDIKGGSLDGDPAEDATVIEVNASPLLTQMYCMGHVETVLDAQMRVLRAIFAE